MTDFLERAKAEMSRLQQEHRRLNFEIGRKLKELDSVEMQMGYLREYLKASGQTEPPKVKPSPAQTISVDIAGMSGAKAASVVLFPDKRLSFDEIFRAMQKRGYRFADRRARSNLRAALHSTHRISRDASDRYYLTTPGDTWWQKDSQARLPDMGT